MNKTFTRFILSFLLVFSILTVSLPQFASAQTSVQTSADLQTRLAAIEQKVEARRKELGIPGMSLAIVKDGEIIFAKGFGYKDFAKQTPATADTQFAIGSVTKAFTALSVLMSQEEGRLSLDESPKKYLPYFKINNAEIDKNITIRDLLTHSSGLARTDFVMLTGKLTREELIRVVGEATPSAGLREKFQYQNIMYAAAGEIVERVQKQSWQKYAAEKILKPLGMTNSNVSVAEMLKAKDYSLGYDYNATTKETRFLPARVIDEVAPAGAINSSAKDMAQWIKFVLAGGELNGKRLVSEKSFAEWIKPQQKISPDGKVGYALGWGVSEHKGLKVLQHGGGIDGFNSQLTLVPEKKLGFIMLTNVSGSSLGSELLPIIWENLLGEEKKAETAAKLPAQETEKLVGKYRFAEAGFDIEIKIENGNFAVVVPGQPVYGLQKIGERYFKLTGAPEGFAIKFMPAQGDVTGIYLEQPQGNYTLPRIKVDGSITKAQAASNPAKELTGKYQPPSGSVTIEVKEVEGKISLVVPGQPPYELKEREKDVYSSIPLPETYSVKVKRATDGKVEGIILVQPQGEFPLKLVESQTNSPKITVDELMTKTIAALGGEANWRKLTTREMKYELDIPYQGLKGFGTSYAKAPNLAANDTTFTALGKAVATDFGYFDGTNGGEILSFLPAEVFTGKRLEDAKVENDFYGLVNWKSGLKSSEVTGTEKVGGEEAYVVVFHPEKASEYTYYISTKTFLPLKKVSVFSAGSSGASVRIPQTFGDYRAVDGVMIPFKSTTDSPLLGDIVMIVKEVKHNVEIVDSTFKPKK